MVQIIGMIFSMIVGTIGHFLYGLTNNKLIGFLFSKNESVWSHIKLGVTPILLFSIVEKSILINNENIFAIKGISIVVLFVTITFLYYLGIKIFKKNIGIYNIAIFYIAIFNSYFVSFLLLNMIFLPFYINFIGYLALIFVIFLYFYEEIAHPNYLIFKNPRLETSD